MALSRMLRPRGLPESPRCTVYLAEATSAINPDEEGRLYEQLGELNVTVFSIAHRHELARFHQFRLNFAADGTGAWSLSEVKAGGAAGGPIFNVLE